MSDTNSGHWLTVSQAAATLGVSERTVRRRCENGKMAARLETTDSGKEWQIDPAAVKVSEGAAIPAAIPAAIVRTPADTIEDSADSIGQGAEALRTTSDEEVAARADNIGHPVIERAAIPADNVRPVETEALLQALSHEKDARIADLQSQIEQQRLQIEASNRMAAEATAALREALKMSQRALPEATTQQADKAASEAPQGSKNAGQGRVTPEQKRTPHREARPFWKVFLGLR